MTTVRVPGIGAVDQRYVYAGGALVAGVVGYAWWRRGSVTSAPPTAEDFAAPDAMGEYENPAYYVPTVPSSQTLPPTSNAEWTIRAMSAMTNVGYDAITVSLALGKYLARQTLTAMEADLVRVAIGMMGPPPVGAFEIIVAPPAPGGGTGGNTPPPPSVPLWSTFQQQQIAGGKFIGKPGQLDWGVIAANTLGPNASMQDVYFRALQLQQLNPEIHRKYPQYVPADVAAGLRKP